MTATDTLGDLILSWLVRHLPSPRDERRPFQPADWQMRRVRRWYELDATGKRCWNRVHDTDPKGKGKALALDTPVPTPTGWTTMGAIRPGDTVLDESGHPTLVVAVSGTMPGRPCFAVTFDDGERIVADAGHLWLTDARRPLQTAIRTTAEIASTLRYPNGRYRSANHSVRLTAPLDLPEADLPVEPYTLGVWLGDGDSDQPRITMGDQDAPEMTRLLEAAGTSVGPRRRTNYAGRYTIRSAGSLRPALRAAGLLGAKHIPAAYLRASRPQRLAVLQGLMDTDGYIDAGSGQCELSLSSERLARGAHELVLTLGIKGTIVEDRMTLHGRDVGPRWRVRFHPPAGLPVFRLSRKLERQRLRHTRRALSGERRIVACEPTPSVPVRCIKVGAPSGMFLAGRAMVPTHNSPMAAAVAIAEFRGPVRFAGWARGGEVYACDDGGCSCGWEYEYQSGEPMGVPWGTNGLPAPWVQVAAVSEAQTANTWAALHAFLAANEQQAAKWLGLEPGRTLVYWRDRVDAKIERATASAGTRTGQPITHAIDDEPQEQLESMRGPDLAQTILENITKMDGWVHFTGNQPVLGRGSVSEMLGHRLVDGRWEKAPPQPRVLFLGVEPSVTPREDMTREELRPLLEEVYEGTPWTPIDRILDDMEDRTAYPWPKVWRLFLNLPWDPAAETSWMPPDLWAERHGEVRLDPREPAFTCVRIGHGHQHAAIVTAQVQGKGGRRVPLNKEGRPVLGEGDRVVLAIRTFEAPEGDWVSITDIETELDGLRKRCPARVLGQVPVGTRGRLRDGHGHGPEIALAGAFTAGTHERFRSKGAIVVDIPSTPERLTPAAELLMQHVTSGVVVHDGDEETARQWANVTAKQMPKGWKPEAIDPSIPIVAPRAAMLALDRANNARRYRPSRVSGI